MGYPQKCTCMVQIITRYDVMKYDWFQWQMFTTRDEIYSTNCRLILSKTTDNIILESEIQ